MATFSAASGRCRTSIRLSTRSSASLGIFGCWLVPLLAATLLLAGCVAPPRFDEPRRLEAQGRLVDALRAYEQMAQVASGANRALVDGEIRRLRAQLARKFQVEAAALLGTGETLPQIDAALRRVVEGLPYDDDLLSLASEQTRLGARRQSLVDARAQALLTADRAAASEDWNGALRSLATAERIEGAAGAFSAKRADWLRRRDTAFAADVRGAIARRELAQARQKLEQSAVLLPAPDPEQIDQLKAEVETLRRTIFIEEQTALTAGRRYFTAYRNLVVEDFPEAKALLEKVRAEGASHYLTLARRERDTDQTRLGFAYFAAVKAKELDSANDEIFAIHRDLSDAIDAFITIRVGVAGFESPASAPGLGNQVADALITYLIDHLPYGVRVIERSQTDQALAGRAADPAAIGRQLDAEIVIVGNVSSLSIERKRSEREVTEIVQVGHEKVANPLYSQMAARHGPNPAAWPYAVPPLIDGAPRTETIRYKQGEEVLNGVMVAYVRSFEAARGTVTQSREFSTTENLKDAFRDAVPLARITYDPLELPTDNEVRERLRARLVEQIAAEVLKRYAGREQRYLRDAETALQRREKDLAALNLAAAHHYSTAAANEITGGRANPTVARVDRLGLFELTE